MASAVKGISGLVVRIGQQGNGRRAGVCRGWNFKTVILRDSGKAF